MSNRFISLCLAVLLLSNLFFYSIASEVTPLTFNDIVLGKVINQSMHLLCFGYILFNRNISKKDHLVITLLVYFGLEFFNEAFNYLFLAQDTVYLDSIIISLQRITLIYVFVQLGSQILSSKNLKNIFQIILLGILVYLLYLLFRKDLAQLLLMWVPLVVLYMFQLYGSNVNAKLVHQIGVATILIVLADAAFVYSGLNNDLNWKSLYLLPRIFLNLGELMIFHKILEKHKTITNN